MEKYFAWKPENYIRPVEYEVVWSDPLFTKWAEKIYGAPEKLFDQLSAVISVGKTDRVGHAHPTGGRNLIYELAEPFMDPQFHLPCPEVDVKGILLTNQGYNLYRDEFRNHDVRKEVMMHKRRKELFGPESLEISKSDRENLQSIRKRGILTPYPAAILKPKYIYLEGRKVTMKDLMALYGLPPDEEMGFYVRAWPVSSSRVLDFLATKDVSFEGSSTHRMATFAGSGSLPVLFKERELLTLIHQGRQRWDFFESERIRQLGSIDDRGDDFNHAYYPLIFRSEDVALLVKSELEKKGIHTRRYFYPSLARQKRAFDYFLCSDFSHTIKHVRRHDKTSSQDPRRSLDLCSFSFRNDDILYRPHSASLLVNTQETSSFQ